MDPSLGHGQHPRQRRHTGRHEGRSPTRRAVLHPAAQHVLLAALRPGRLPQLQELHPGASRHRRLVRRRGHEQGMAATVFAVTDPCHKNQGWTTGWRRLRAHSDAHFKEAVEEAAALHAHDELFSMHIEPEPAPEDPWNGPCDAPMPDAPLELELIDMPPAPASSPPMSNFKRCIALRPVFGAGLR